MIAQRGLTLVELDARASESVKPYGIITADCSNPHEYDDGISVTPLPSAQELYKVSVFAADTSGMYFNEDTVKRVLKRTESRYRNPHSRTETYEPMLEEEQIQKTHFASGTIRSALVVSFIIGQMYPPDNVSISFGNVEVLKNYEYRKFGNKCKDEPGFKKYGRAAAFILHHLGTEYSDDEEAVHQSLIRVPQDESWQRGSNINQAFMVGANHLVAKTMQAEGRLAIYRTHDKRGATYAELIPPEFAMYSTTPGYHQGLDLSPYSRVTSPLRRGEDFMMHGLLRARQKDRDLTGRDYDRITTMVQRLNQRIVSDIFQGVTGSEGQRPRQRWANHSGLHAVGE
jgi:hypothetical protein